jgi:hypothetical protein
LAEEGPLGAKDEGEPFACYQPAPFAEIVRDRPRSFIALNCFSIYPAAKESAAAGGMVIWA